MKEKGITREELERILEDAKERDFDYSQGKILSSMCTKPAKISKEIWGSFIETNLGDAGLFCGTKALEKEVIGTIGALLNHKEAKGSEAKERQENCSGMGIGISWLIRLMAMSVRIL